MACRTLNYKLVHQYDLSNVNMYNRYRLWSLLARCNHGQGLQRGLTRAQDQARAASCRGQHLRGTAWCATVESLVATQPRTYVDYSGTPGASGYQQNPSPALGMRRGCEVTEQQGGCAAAHSTASTTSHASSTNSSLFSLRFSSSKAPSTILRPGGHRVGAGAASSVG